MIPGSQPDQDNGEDGAKHYSPKVLSAINNAKIHSLKELKLNDMGVEWIPELIGNLTHLTSLDLSGTLIIEFLCRSCGRNVEIQSN